MRKHLLFLGDICALGLALLFVVFKEGGWVFQSRVFAFHFLPFLLLSGITILVLYAVDLYDFKNIKPVASNLWRIAVALGIALAIGAILFYTLPIFRITPKTNLAIFFALFGVIFILWRRLFFRIFSRSFTYNILVWSEPSDIASDFIREIQLHPQRGYGICGQVTDADDLARSLRHMHVHMLVISESLVFPPQLLDIIFQKKITVLRLGDMYEHLTQKVALSTASEASFVYHIQHHSGLTKILYRIVECIIAGLVLLLTSPFLAVVALAVYLEDKGPILYTHKRLGLVGKEFTLYKFRSMRVDATDNFGEWRTKGDSRVTRVGRIISKLHIDEVPQMFNVLRGDMGIVGPRPEMVSLGKGLEEQIPLYHLRLLVKPGFTGWAQIKYRNPQTIDEYRTKLEYDLYYIKHREPFLDIGILVRTFQIIFSHV